MTKFLKNFINSNTGMLIRIDDIAENMNWDLMEKCEVLFDDMGKLKKHREKHD